MIKNIKHNAWFMKYPRLAIVSSALLTIFTATSYGIITEKVLQIFFDTTHLGTWSILATIGSLVAFAVRVNTIALAISMEDQLITARDEQENEITKPVQEIVNLEKAVAEINKTFQPITWVISIGILSATSILIAEYSPITAKQIPEYFSLHPISIAAFISAISIVLSDTRNVDILLGSPTGSIRKLAQKVGKLSQILTTIIGIVVPIITAIIILIT